MHKEFQSIRKAKIQAFFWIDFMQKGSRITTDLCYYMQKAAFTQKYFIATRVHKTHKV